MEQGPVRVLFVDDDEDDYILTRDLLTELGGSRFELEWASTYEAGLTAIKKKRHDVYLLDYRLGERNGLELLQRAIALGIPAPIILLTSQGDARVDIAAMEMGASDYLNKTTLSAELLERSIRYAMERARTEEALRESEDKFRSLSENAPDIIYTLGVDGSFTYVNPAWEEILGYSKEETLGKYFVDFVKEKDAEDYVNLSKSIRNGRKVIRDETIILLNKDGSPRLFNFSGAPDLNPAGEVTGTVGVLKDITEQRKTEAQLQQAQKMEAIGTLAGGIAHDFNNILSAILGHTDIANLSLPDEHQAKNNLKEVLKAGHRARNLVSQILSFARQSEQKRIPIQIHPILKEALKLLRSSLPTDIDIRHHIETDIGIIEVDPTQIHQVLMNLCTNAAHAMREQGGILEVKLTRVNLDASQVALHHDLQPGPHQRLTVSDTGHGMIPEVAERIFDPYFTTKEKGEGTGLGLAVVHSIIKGSDGTITVYSEPGKGTTFHVYFPIKEREELKAEKDSRPDESPTGNERILLIDDEETILEVGKQMLERLGYKVVVKNSSIEALELFTKQPDRFDLVITDMTMPGLRGDRLAKDLMNIRPDIPVILCTGFSEHIAEERAKEMGIREFVMKPFVTDEFARIVRKALD